MPNMGNDIPNDIPFKVPNYQKQTLLSQSRTQKRMSREHNLSEGEPTGEPWSNIATPPDIIHIPSLEGVTQSVFNN